MTQIRYAVIDNKRKKKGHGYNIIFDTLNFDEFKEYIRIKGLI